MTGRCVTHKLRYAWLEYEDARDAVQFDRVFSSCAMGWRNLFLDLPKGSSASARVDRGHPDLDIALIPSKDNPKVRGLIATPKMVHNEFLGKWVLNPGVNKDTGKLTFGSDATDVADLLCVSGHGYSGVVSGGGQRFPMGDLMKDNRTMSVSGRLKYIFIPTCGNCGFMNREKWLPILQKPNPIHGVYGYAGKYIGDSIGGMVQHKFGQKLQANPKMRILDAWAEANKDLKQPWGAELLADAVDDTMAKWISVGLSVPEGSMKVMHFDWETYEGNGKGGKEVKGSINPIGGAFAMLDPVRGVWEPISGRQNRERTDVGLIPGRQHRIAIVNETGFWKPGDKITLVFYYYRQEKPDMDLNQMFDFRLNDPKFNRGVRLLKDKNVKKEGFPNGRFDAIEKTIQEDESFTTRIDFFVKPDAHKPHELLDGHHGYIWFGIFPSGVDPTDVSKRLDEYERAALLREPL